MSLFKKIFGKKDAAEIPPEANNPTKLVDLSSIRGGDVALAGQPVDCAGVDWNAAEQLRFAEHVLPARVGDRLAPVLTSVEFEGNPHCSPADAAVLFAMVGEHAPTRVMEVGAGHTTRVIRHAMRVYNLPGELISIDPAPRTDIEELVDAAVSKPVQEVPAEDFAIMQPGEMLFVDSTHFFMPGGEIDYLLGTVIPALASGVLVGFHGIRLPRNYTREEILAGWNEQEEVLRWLRERKPTVLFSGGWMEEHHPGKLAAALPKGCNQASTALWLRL